MKIPVMHDDQHSTAHYLRKLLLLQRIEIVERIFSKIK